ncbi:MAG: repair protein RecN [Fibrobacterota bacterium]|jgi:DNA repair protein RecN (Recombination protein N)
MLLELEIRDLAIFEKAQVEIPEGFVALTGETGSGKSVFLSALDLLRGLRADASMVRQGADKAVVSARFAAPTDTAFQALLEEIGAECEEGELLLVREIQATGRSRARVGGANASAKDLSRVARRLYDVHGQHAEQRLFDEEEHLPILTRLAGAQDLLETYRTSWKAWRDLLTKAREVKEQAQELAKRREFLEFQWKELEDAKLLPDEEKTLQDKLDLLGQLGQMGEWMGQARGVLHDESPLQRAISQLSKVGLKLASADPKLSGMTEIIERLREATLEASELVEEYEIPAEADPAELDRMNARLSVIQKLKSRHRCDYPGLVALHKSLRHDLDLLEDGGYQAERFEAQAKGELEKTLAVGQNLSALRAASARTLDTEVTTRLQALGMPGAEFRTRMDHLPEPASQGLEKAVFELCPNPGEGFRELAETASGGEASRIMLAITGVLSAADPVPLSIFDEVDTGLGGVVATRVAQELSHLAQGRQVLAVTHLPQVAASADHQLAIAKETVEGRTRSNLIRLRDKDRENEICRMLGDPDNLTVRAHAAKLLEPR